jgi:hypothetical protein
VGRHGPPEPNLAVSQTPNNRAIRTNRKAATCGTVAWSKRHNYHKRMTRAQSMQGLHGSQVVRRSAGDAPTTHHEAPGIQTGQTAHNEPPSEKPHTVRIAKRPSARPHLVRPSTCPEDNHRAKGDPHAKRTPGANPHAKWTSTDPETAPPILRRRQAFPGRSSQPEDQVAGYHMGRQAPYREIHRRP